MRELTREQKKMLLAWANKELRKEYMFDRVEEMDGDTYEEINAINPCEIFYQNANNYLGTLKPIYLHGLSELGITGWSEK
mgnify:CR=1 FL=1